jgi:hypothetical protein
VRTAKLAKREVKQGVANEKAMRTLRIKKGKAEDVTEAAVTQATGAPAPPARTRALPTPGNFYRELMTKAGRPAMSMYDGAIKARQNPTGGGEEEESEEEEEEEAASEALVEDDDSDVVIVSETPGKNTGGVGAGGESSRSDGRGGRGGGVRGGRGSRGSKGVPDDDDDDDDDDAMMRVVMEVSRNEELERQRNAANGDRQTTKKGKGASKGTGTAGASSAPHCQLGDEAAGESGAAGTSKHAKSASVSKSTEGREATTAPSRGRGAAGTRRGGAATVKVDPKP